MITVLEILVTLLAIVLIGIVVAQKSKTQGMGAGFGGGAEDLFGGRARGMDALLSKMTIVVSIVFAVLVLLLGRLMHTF
ncbi:MAG: preprotein translocase subunit SecG [Megasphaera sp.]|nr:preprotein translocase subunit SecG [Megasphaera sp.]MCI1247779.1 preprotein translocase subunit SecG [Megasphaera sp.]